MLQTAKPKWKFTSRLRNSLSLECLWEECFSLDELFLCLYLISRLWSCSEIVTNRWTKFSQRMWNLWNIIHIPVVNICFFSYTINTDLPNSKSLLKLWKCLQNIFNLWYYIISFFKPFIIFLSKFCFIE